MKKFCLLILLILTFANIRAQNSSTKKWTEPTWSGGIREYYPSEDGGFDFIETNPCGGICQKGLIWCVACSGTGQRYDYTLGMTICPYCFGKGYMLCSWCGGKGFTVTRGHRYANGTEWMQMPNGEIRYFDGSPNNFEFDDNFSESTTAERECIHCSGTGKCGYGVINKPFSHVKELFCNGTGKCGKCLGQGYVYGSKCLHCNGSGVCPECHGTKYCKYCKGTGKRH